MVLIILPALWYLYKKLYKDEEDCSFFDISPLLATAITYPPPPNTVSTLTPDLFKRVEDVILVKGVSQEVIKTRQYASLQLDTINVTPTDYLLEISLPRFNPIPLEALQTVHTLMFPLKIRQNVTTNLPSSAIVNFDFSTIVWSQSLNNHDYVCNVLLVDDPLLNIPDHFSNNQILVVYRTSPGPFFRNTDEPSVMSVIFTNLT